MIKLITKLALLVAVIIPFAAFAGGPSTFNTTWTPSNLFVKANNGEITTGTVTVTSNYIYNGGYGTGQRPLIVNYTTSNISPLELNASNFTHYTNIQGTNVTSVIGYSIDLTTNTYVGTVLGSVKIQSNGSFSFNGNMPFTIVTQNLSTPFITLWNLSIAGSGATQLSFDVEAADTVNYSWATYPNATATGTGTFTGTTALIENLPTDATISLSIDGANFQHIFINDGADKDRLIDITQWGTTAWTSMKSAFLGCSNLQISATDVPDLSGVTDMSRMFNECTVLNSPTNIDTWNTSLVTDMSYIFYDALAFNQPVGNWNTTSVTTMEGMFRNATAFNQSISGWNTANVTDMRAMFLSTPYNYPLNSWNVSKVTDMYNMFYSAQAFNQPLNNWDISNVTDMNGMLNNAYAFNQSLGAWGAKLNTDVDLHFILDQSGLSIPNYDATLEGFAISTITGKSMGVYGLYYCNAATAHAKLANTLTGNSWTFNDRGAAVPASITTQPVSQTICGSYFPDFSVSAIGTQLSYAWSNGLSTTRNMNTTIAGTNYTVTVSGACGIPAVSTAVGLTVNIPTSIVAQPLSQTICGGNVASISISAIGTNISYYWNTGETSTSISKTVAGSYLVTVSGACGKATTSATLVLNDCITNTQSFDIYNSAVSIYPNPSSGLFSISGIESVVVYDMIGNIVAQSKSDSFYISTKGLYVAEAKTASGKKYIKLIVE